MIKILLVEEDTQVSAGLTRALAERGYRTRVETNGAAALLAAHAELPDCIVLDLTMPILEGQETMQALRHDPHTALIPIIALASATRDTDETLVNAVMSGANCYLVKPPDPHVVCAAVERLVTLQPNAK